jgi:site-specific DNA-adenine methylase
MLKEKMSIWQKIAKALVTLPDILLKFQEILEDIEEICERLTFLEYSNKIETEQLKELHEDVRELFKLQASQKDKQQNL